MTTSDPNGCGVDLDQRAPIHQLVRVDALSMP